VEPQQVVHLLSQIGFTGAGRVQESLAFSTPFLLQCSNKDVTLSHREPALRGLLWYSAKSADGLRKCF
jgi:hypothetical protein